MKRNKSIIFLSSILILMGSSLLSAESSSFIPDEKTLDSFLSDTVKTYKIPGLAAAVVNDEGVLFSAGYKLSESDVDITPETPFLLGSTTKTFTALAIMRLVELGQVELDEPVKKYLPQFQLATPDYEGLITVRHLLNHTSGMSEKGMPGVTLGKNSLQEELISLKSNKPVSPPGLKYDYFNANYRLLGLIIEKTSGMKYGEFLDQELFKPLGMSSTFPGPIGVKNLAPGHGAFLGLPVSRAQRYPAGALPSGYIVSSAADVSRFLIDELRAENGKSSILSPKSVRETWLPPKNAVEGYAMGWLAVVDSDENRFLIHGGSLENYQSFFYLDPETNTGFVFMMNQGGLLPAVSGFNTVRNGLIEIVNNRQPLDGPGILPVAIITGLFILVSGIEVFRIIRIKNWRNRVKQKKRWKPWINISIEFLSSFFLIFGFIPLMNTIMGDKASWSMICNMIPEGFYLLCIIIILGFFRGSLKTWILVKNTI